LRDGTNGPDGLNGWNPGSAARSALARATWFTLMHGGNASSTPSTARASCGGTSTSGATAAGA